MGSESRSLFVPSLPNTKPRKNKVQQILMRHLTGDLAQVVQGFADVDGEEVAGDADGEPVQHFHQAGLRGQECPAGICG